MALLGVQDVTVAFGGPAVLDRVNFSIDRGERVCLIGRNGSGKSTLLQVLDGALTPDGGAVICRGGVSVAHLAQSIPPALAGTMFDVVANGLGANGELLAQYHQASQRLGATPTAAALREVDRLHTALDAANAWHMHTVVDTVLQHLGLHADADFATASGGRKRQALLARALVRRPDVVLLDEPTNHLDIDAVEWMESYLVVNEITLVFVTHDRAFVRNVATRIIELDRGQLVDWGDSYDRYLERKDAALAVEAREWAEFDRKLAQEEVWIRTGIQARRTRNEGRVRALEALRVERGMRRDRVGTAKLQAHEGERSGRLVAETTNVAFARGDRTIVRDVNVTIMRGDRIGVIGSNGSGKTTLLRLLLGELEADSGAVRLGTNIELAYFDQLRETLDPDQSVFASIADGADFVRIGGAERHVHGYLQDFLFTPDRARTPVRALSGGERNRLLLARLFTRQFNLLLLDEPTNDLDIETLDLLEALLLEYTGTLIVVSHDREFLDHVVTSTLALEPGGRVGEYAGGYTDWVRQRPRAVLHTPSPKPRVNPVLVPTSRKPRKLTFKEQRELDALPNEIASQEGERDALYALLSDPNVSRDVPRMHAARARVALIEDKLLSLLERWEHLETIAQDQ